MEKLICFFLAVTLHYASCQTNPNALAFQLNLCAEDIRPAVPHESRIDLYYRCFSATQITDTPQACPVGTPVFDVSRRQCTTLADATQVYGANYIAGRSPQAGEQFPSRCCSRGWRFNGVTFEQVECTGIATIFSTTTFTCTTDPNQCTSIRCEDDLPQINQDIPFCQVLFPVQGTDCFFSQQGYDGNIMVPPGTRFNPTTCNFERGVCSNTNTVNAVPDLTNQKRLDTNCPSSLEMSISSSTNLPVFESIKTPGVVSSFEQGSITPNGNLQSLTIASGNSVCLRYFNGNEIRPPFAFVVRFSGSQNNNINQQQTLSVISSAGGRCTDAEEALGLVATYDGRNSWTIRWNVRTSTSNGNRLPDTVNQYSTQAIVSGSANSLIRVDFQFSRGNIIATAQADNGQSTPFTDSTTGSSVLSIADESFLNLGSCCMSLGGSDALTFNRVSFYEGCGDYSRIPN